MAWIAQINYTLSQLIVYFLCFIIQNIYIFRLLRYRDSNAFVHVRDFLECHEFGYFCDAYVEFLHEGALWCP